MDDKRDKVMAVLYIHKSPKPFILMSDDQLRQFIGTGIFYPCVIGDLSLWNKNSRLRLLKLIEENPQIDVYSSQDLYIPILQSRFVSVVKDMSVKPVFDKDYSIKRQFGCLRGLFKNKEGINKL